MVEEAAEGGRRIIRELAVITLLAFTVYLVLSLASHDAGHEPNLGGPLGATLARALQQAFGCQAYVLAALMGWLSHRIWSGAPPPSLGRETAGGIVVLVALTVVAGFCNSPGTNAGGATGLMLATTLHRYLDFGGGYLVVILALVGGLALMAGRAPTELAASMVAATRPRQFPSSPAGEDENST